MGGALSTGLAALVVAISQVAPVYNRIPGSAREGLDLSVSVRFENPTDRPLAVSLESAFASFDAAKRGEEIKADFAGFTLPPGASSGELRVVSRAMAPEGHEQQTVYVTLVFRCGEQRVTARGAGSVILAD